MFFAVISSCKKVEKDMNDYYPTVTTISATKLPDGSVEVKGEITSIGLGDVSDAGFCMSTSPIPEMLDNQAIANIQGNLFSVTYSNFELYTRYYFRTWSANRYGYTYGNIIHVDSIQKALIVAPCSPPMNTIDIGAGGLQETYSSVSFNGTNTFQAHSNSIVAHFEFDSKPVTGIYTTSSSAGPGAVCVFFFTGSMGPTLNSGTPVYVNQTSSNSWEIVLCNAPWTYSGTQFYMTTKFTYPL